MNDTLSFLNRITPENLSILIANIGVTPFIALVLIAFFFRAFKKQEERIDKLEKFTNEELLNLIKTNAQVIVNNTLLLEHLSSTTINNKNE